MKTSERLDILEQVLPQTGDTETLRLIAWEAIKLAQAQRLEHQFETLQLRAYLRQALRGWIVCTPDVEEVVIAFQIGREAGLGH